MGDAGRALQGTDRAGGAPRRGPRRGRGGNSDGHVPRKVREAAACLSRGRPGDRGERLPAERRRGRHGRDVGGGCGATRREAARPCGRVQYGRREAGIGHGSADPGRPKTPEEDRVLRRRHRPVRAQRGLRRRKPRRDAGTRNPSREVQRERRRGGPRPSDRMQRRSGAHDPHLRDEGPRGETRPRDAVPRRRQRGLDDYRTTVTDETPRVDNPSQKIAPGSCQYLSSLVRVAQKSGETEYPAGNNPDWPGGIKPRRVARPNQKVEKERGTEPRDQKGGEKGARPAPFWRFHPRSPISVAAEIDAAKLVIRTPVPQTLLGPGTMPRDFRLSAGLHACYIRYAQ